MTNDESRPKSRFLFPSHTVSLLVSTVAIATVAIALAASAAAKVPPALKGPIATVGDRSVEAIDVQRAAGSLGYDPPQGQTARAWRRLLLERCVDRELLAAEADRRGILDNDSLRNELSEREFGVLMRTVYDKDLLPGVLPKPDEFATIKASGHYRYCDLYYILLRDDAAGGRRSIAEKIANRARQGARWDSLARIYSGHPPSASAGGHFGLVLVNELEPASQDSIAHAAPGTVFGPYSGPYGHNIYKVGGWVDVSDDSLMRLLIDERTRSIYQNYWSRVLAKYHFAVDSVNADNALMIFRSETPDSILASLGRDGTRRSLGIRPAAGIIARADGIAVTIADIIRGGHASPNSEGFAPMRDRDYLGALAAATMLHTLIVRDARERGFDKDPTVARQLRLMKDEIATRGMVAQARPADPTEGALRAYIEKNAARYRRPAARLARVAMFPTADSARGALRAWNGVGFPPDSTLQAMKFRVSGRAASGSIFPGTVATVSVPEGTADPLSMSLRGLAAGQFAPVTQLVQGWAVIQMTGREEAAPLTEQEAAPRALRDWREEMENQWVIETLERLRAKTPVTVFPARLEAVRIMPPGAANAAKRAS